MYQFGLKANDPAEAYAWFKNAAEHSSVKSHASVKAMALQGDYLFNGVPGLAKDAEQGSRLLTDAAVRGSDHAAYALGCEYFSGKGGISKDKRLAMYWLHKVVDGRSIVKHLHQDEVKKANKILRKLESTE